MVRGWFIHRWMIAPTSSEPIRCGVVGVAGNAHQVLDSLNRMGDVEEAVSDAVRAWIELTRTFIRTIINNDDPMRHVFVVFFRNDGNPNHKEALSDEEWRVTDAFEAVQCKRKMQLMMLGVTAHDFFRLYSGRDLMEYGAFPWFMYEG